MTLVQEEAPTHTHLHWLFYYIYIFFKLNVHDLILKIAVHNNELLNELKGLLK